MRTLSMKLSWFRPRPAGQSRLDVIFVAQHTLRAVPDPPSLRIGTDMHGWIVERTVGRIVEASASVRSCGALIWLPGRMALCTSVAPMIAASAFFSCGP